MITRANPNLSNENFSSRKLRGRARKWILGLNAAGSARKLENTSYTTKSHSNCTENSHKFTCSWKRCTCRTEDRLGKYVSWSYSESRSCSTWNLRLPPHFSLAVNSSVLPSRPANYSSIVATSYKHNRTNVGISSNSQKVEKVTVFWCWLRYIFFDQEI